jgi:hypothetical protein
MRRIMVGIAALLVSACGGEVYPVAPTEAFMTLSGVGTPTGMNPLPGGLYPVSVRVESVPADNTVQWHFTHEGDELARIVAKVEPEGETSSKITVWYVEGTAPDEKWRNAQARQLIKTHVQRLVAEAVDAKMEKRQIDSALREDVVKNITVASAASMMRDASAAIDEEITRQKEAERQSAADSAVMSSKYTSTKPTTNLSGY